MNTTQLECFLEVANQLNFSRAAQQLKITQPAVSHQIKTLEDELGVKLFSRTSKSVRLTQEGHLFIQYAQDILKLSGMSRARVRASRSAQPKRFGIGCRSSVELRLIQPALRRLREEEPDVLPILRVIPFDSLENLLWEGDIQVMFTFQESAPKKGVYRELLRCPLACLCAVDHPLSHLKEARLAELAGRGRLATVRPPMCPPGVMALQAQLVAAQGPGQVIFCENQEVVQTLVETGYAFTVAPDFPPLHAPSVRYIPVAGAEPISFGISYLSGEGRGLAGHFYRLLREDAARFGFEGEETKPQGGTR